MLTSLIFSVFVMKLRAMSTFSILCACTRGFLLYRPSFLVERSSSKCMRLTPLERPSARSDNTISLYFSCSLHQRVNVFSWILFHSASRLVFDSISSTSEDISTLVRPTLLYTRGKAQIVYLSSQAAAPPFHIITR